MRRTYPINDYHIKDAIKDCSPKGEESCLRVSKVSYYLTEIQEIEASYLDDWLDNKDRVVVKETDNAYYFSLYLSDTFWIDIWALFEINDQQLRATAYQAHARQSWSNTNFDWENRYAFVLGKR